MSVLRVQNVSKAFPSTLALDNVTCQFESGKVNALVGKNGSGKSTLVKIINGVHRPTSGEIFLDDRKLDYNSPVEAKKQKIATVYQEFSLFPGLTVAENIMMGQYVMKGKLVDWDKTYEAAKDFLDSMRIGIDPHEEVSHLSTWECQMVEIAKAMSSNPKVLLLDEPTSSLAQNETKILFDLIRNLKKKDVIIIYITHRLHELWEIGDTCSVLRDGVLTGSLSLKEATDKELLHLMFGDTEVKTKPQDLKVGKEVVLHVENLSRKGAFENISFDLHKNEVLGIAGMLGSGRTELLRAIFGIDKFDSGTLLVEGKPVKKTSPETMKNLGLALTPENRKLEGLIQVHSIKSNLCNASLRKLSGKMFMHHNAEEKAAKKQIGNLDIKISSIEQAVMNLSGGNQQKVVVGNWLNTSPRIMLFDEPSRGIDVNAKQQIFDIIWNLSRQGVSSIVVSSELEELIEVCHRIIIMRHGRFTDEVKTEDINIEQLYSICMREKAE